MNKNDKISIVMPNYNSSLFLEKTINSIKNQTYGRWELIIIDDNSNSETKELLKKIKKNKKIKVHYLLSNKGDGFCRLYGIKKSKYKYIAFIDSDDIWNKNKLLFQYNFMIKNNYNFTYTAYTAFKRYNNSIKEWKIFPKKKFNFNSFIKDTSIATSSMMINKEIIKKIKLSNSPNFDDFYFKCQILKKVKFAYGLNKYLLRYRISSKSLSTNKFRNLFWLWEINRKFNKLNFVHSLISLISISVNSLKKYGFK